MPMIPGKSKKVISQNIKEFHGGKTYAKTKRKFGKKKADAQAIAASYASAGKGKGRGGSRKVMV